MLYTIKNKASQFKNFRLLVCNLNPLLVDDTASRIKCLKKSFQLNCVRFPDNFNKYDFISTVINTESDIYKRKALLREFNNLILESYRENNYIMYPNIKLILEKIRKQNVRVMVCSDYSIGTFEDILYKTDLIENTDYYYSFYHIKHKPPHPTVINDISNKLNIDKYRIRKMGNLLRDIMEGKNSNCGINIGIVENYEKQKIFVNNGANRLSTHISEIDL